jgi:hypothetical protein
MSKRPERADDQRRLRSALAFALVSASGCVRVYVMPRSALR